MIQDIITLIIVITAFIAAVRRMAGFFTGVMAGHSRCGEGCTGCPVSGLKKEIRARHS